MLAEAVGGKSRSHVKARLAAGDEEEDRPCGDRSKDLGDNVGDDLGRGEAAAGPEADGDRRVQVAAGNVADGVGHGHHGEAESKGHSEKTDPHVREGRREHGAAAPAEHKPKRTEKLRTIFVHFPISF